MSQMLKKEWEKERDDLTVISSRVMKRNSDH
jgi:hypothetical protein